VVKRAIKNFVEKGRVVRGYLGVSVQPVTKEIAEQFKLDGDTGALVTDVTRGSPAEKSRNHSWRRNSKKSITTTSKIPYRSAIRFRTRDIGSNLNVALFA